jgi:hypothetical protein
MSYIRLLLLYRSSLIALRLSKELNDGSHLCSGEPLGVLLVAYILHRLPHAAGIVHLATKEAQR